MNTYYIVFITVSFFALFSYSRIGLVRNIFLFLIFIVLVLFAGTRYFIDNDYWLYDYLFYLASSKPSIFLVDNPALEWCVWLITKVSQLFFDSYKDSNLMSFVIFAVLGVGLKMVGILKSKVSLFFAILLYFGNWYLGQEMTTVRAGVAAGIFLWALNDLDKKNDKTFLLKICVSLLFHYSAAIFFVIWLILKLKIQLKYFIYATFLSLLFPITKFNILQWLYVDKFIPKVQTYNELARKGVGVDELNVFNFKIIISFVVLLAFIFFYKKVAENERLIIWLKIHCFSIIIFFLLSPVQMTFSLRTFELVSVIQLLLFPSLIAVFPKKFAFIPVLLLLAVGIFQSFYSISMSGNYQSYQSWLLP